MRSIYWLALPLSFLVACTTPIATQRDKDRYTRKLAGIVSPPCETASNPTCAFTFSPVKLVGAPKRLPKRPLDFFETGDRLEFLDANRRRWIAPKNTLTDGASIPQIFISMIGNPRSAEFLNAGAIHDAYCGIGNEQLNTYHAARWQEVHRMFYDALRIGGTPARKAKIMFAAVYLGGPRWDIKQRALGNVSNSSMQNALSKAIGFIESENPTLQELEFFLLDEERLLLQIAGKGLGDQNQNQAAVTEPTVTPTDPTGVTAFAQ